MFILVFNMPWCSREDTSASIAYVASFYTQSSEIISQENISLGIPTIFTLSNGTYVYVCSNHDLMKII